MTTAEPGPPVATGSRSGHLAAVGVVGHLGLFATRGGGKHPHDQRYDEWTAHTAHTLTLREGGKNMTATPRFKSGDKTTARSYCVPYRESA